jgi:hypothetical protein
MKAMKILMLLMLLSAGLLSFVGCAMSPEERRETRQETRTEERVKERQAERRDWN